MSYKPLEIPNKGIDCCDLILNQLEIIEGKLKPIIVKVPVPVEVIVYKEKIVPIKSVEYINTETTIYVKEPCNSPKTPLPSIRVQHSELPIIPPSNVKVAPDPIYLEFKLSNSRRVSPRTINGKIVYVELGN